MSHTLRIVSRRSLRPAIAAGFVGAVIAIPAPATLAQSRGPGLTTISADEIQRVVASAGGAASDLQIKVVDLGQYNVGVSVLRRGPTTALAPVGAVRHERVTEVYYVVSGSGTLVVGGEADIVDLKPIDPEGLPVKTVMGPSSSGRFKDVEALVRRKLSAGDMAIVPAGMFHGFIDIADHVEYLSIRPDVEKLLPAGYINPTLKE